MAITPQAIKDQEFQVKFRGYDTVEVKAYLELIAEEFFELLEQARQQVDELEGVVGERDVLLEEKQKLKDELDETLGDSKEIKSEVAERYSEVSSLQKQIEELQEEIKMLEEDRDAKEEEWKKSREKAESDLQESSEKLEVEIAVTREKIEAAEKAAMEEKERNDKLRDKLEYLELQNEELRSEEVDLKSTLVAAQKFTSDMKKKSEDEAKEIVLQAKNEAEKMRQATLAELASYPAEIERLRETRNKVRKDLEETLHLCLENLDIFGEKQGDDDYGELYQKIKFDENGMIDTSDLDDIDVDLNLPVSKTVHNAEGDTAEDVFSMKGEMGDFHED